MGKLVKKYTSWNDEVNIFNSGGRIGFLGFPMSSLWCTWHAGLQDSDM